jgi:hypothetical protein
MKQPKQHTKQHTKQRFKEKSQPKPLLKLEPVVDRALSDDLFETLLRSCEQARKEREDRANGRDGSSRKKITRS